MRSERIPGNLLTLSLWVLLLPGLAVGDDVVIGLGSGDDFVIEDSTSTERWRIDEAGDLTRSGNLFLHGGTGCLYFGESAGTGSTGLRNVALGSGALDAGTSSNDNVAIGYNALTSFSDSFGGNTAIGSVTLDVLTSGGNNVALGPAALGGVTSGSNNLALGASAGASLTSGSNNVFIANVGSSSDSGAIKIGTYNTHSMVRLGNRLEIPSGPDLSLGTSGYVMLGAENSFNLGMDLNEVQARHDGGWATLYLNRLGGTVQIGHNPDGRVRIPWINPNSTVMTDGSSYLYGATSTRRHKRNLQPFEDDYEKILTVSPYTFEYLEQPSFPKGQFMGYMAEDLHDAGMSHLVRYDNDGVPVNINYDQISVYLIELVKQQRATLLGQNQAIEAQREENSALLSRILALEAERGQSAELMARMSELEVQLVSMHHASAR